MIRTFATVGTWVLIATGASAQQSGKPAPLVPAAPPAMAARSEPVVATTTPGSLSWSQARSRIEARGYADVRGLIRDGMGGWRGKALKDGRAVNVAVASSGEVSAR